MRYRGDFEELERTVRKCPCRLWSENRGQIQAFGRNYRILACDGVNGYMAYLVTHPADEIHALEYGPSETGNFGTKTHLKLEKNQVHQPLSRQKQSPALLLREEESPEEEEFINHDQEEHSRVTDKELIDEVTGLTLTDMQDLELPFSPKETRDTQRTRRELKPSSSKRKPQGNPKPQPQTDRTRMTFVTQLESDEDACLGCSGGTGEEDEISSADRTRCSSSRALSRSADINSPPDPHRADSYFSAYENRAAEMDRLKGFSVCRTFKRLLIGFHDSRTSPAECNYQVMLLGDYIRLYLHF